MIKAVIFDLDGTLMDSLDTLCRAFNDGITAFNLAPVEKECIFGWMNQGAGLAHILAETCPSLKQDPARVNELMLEIRRLYLERRDAETRLAPGARELLELLKEKGLKIGIVTSRTAPPERIWAEVDRLKLGGLVDVVVTSSESARKPSPEAVIKCLKMLAISPGEGVLVGDSQADIRAGKSAGVRTVAIATGVSLREKLVLDSPDFIFDNLAGLADHLDTVLGIRGEAMKPQSQEIFLFAAKAGSLEGYLYNRRRVEPLDNWVNNLSRMYPALPAEVREEIAPLLAPVLKRALEQGKKTLSPEQREKLQAILTEASAGV